MAFAVALRAEEEDECHHLAEDIEESCPGYEDACHDMCDDDMPADSDAIAECAHDAEDCDGVRACILDATIMDCVPLP